MMLSIHSCLLGKGNLKESTWYWKRCDALAVSHWRDDGYG